MPYIFPLASSHLHDKSTVYTCELQNQNSRKDHSPTLFISTHLTQQWKCITGLAIWPFSPELSEFTQPFFVRCKIYLKQLRREDPLTAWNIQGR